MRDFLEVRGGATRERDTAVRHRPPGDLFGDVSRRFQWREGSGLCVIEDPVLGRASL